MNYFNTKRIIATEAKPEDIPYIIELEKNPENSRFVWLGTTEQHEREINDPNIYLMIFYHEDQKIGYMLGEVHPSKTFELRRIVIEKKHQGFGKEVMVGIFGFIFEDLKLHRLWLDVYPDNKVGIHLYESLGMRREGHFKESYLQDDTEWRDQLIYAILEDEYRKIYL